ncbi:ELKS/Rab6-interacting/CAST family protein [Bacillus subtilis]|nr:ELKS/Rab6-interacting/CAST family protein [Bacillus subtilis]
MEVEFNGKNLDDLCIKTMKGDGGMTKIHVLADETLGSIKREYVEVDRKAEVGEKVIVVNADVRGEEPYDNGNIFEVRKSYKLTDAVRTVCDRVIGRSEYRVLVPVESAEADEPQPADLIDVVSNLATRVADLERTIKHQKDEIDTLHKDNRTLGEELQKAKQDLRETMDDVSCMYEEIKQAESDINEMSFAVEDLAEAVKKTDPVYGERIFTAEEVVAVMTALKVRP